MTTLQIGKHERLTLKRRTPELLEVEADFDPTGKLPPAHLHPAQDEHFEVLAGVVRVRTPEGERRYAAGESLDIPRGTPHCMANGGDVPARVLWQVRPALRTDAFWAALSRARTPLGQLMAVLRFRREFRLARL
jgi:quercetin dioxygenase-like cupin family protein